MKSAEKTTDGTGHRYAIKPHFPKVILRHSLASLLTYLSPGRLPMRALQHTVTFCPASTRNTVEGTVTDSHRVPYYRIISDQKPPQK